MSKTLEVRQLVEAGYNIFDFDYKLYDENMKSLFEKDFIEYYYFRNICSETLGRWKKEIQITLNRNYEYYKEYYETVKALQDTNMMNTKSIKETFVREITGSSEQLTESTDKSTVTNDSNSTEKFSNTPRQSIKSLDKHITSASVNNNNVSGTTNGLSNGKVESSNSGTERTEFESTGNLGVSSDGLLIEKWREIIVDIHQHMFDRDLDQLFFQIF